MKIKTKTLTDFLNKFTMMDEQHIDDALFHFEHDGLYLSANNSANMARSDAFLHSSAFTEYDAIGNVGLNELSLVIKVLGRFTDVEIKKSGNLLMLSGDSKSVDIELVADAFIASTPTKPMTLEYTEVFDIDSTILNNFLNDASINSDCKVTIETVPGKVIFKNAGKYKFVTEIPIQGIKGGFKSRFGCSSLSDCYKKLDGTLQISLGTDYPIKIRETKDKYNVTIILAPRVDN